MRLPVVFVSHGAPDALLHAPEAVAAWQSIGRQVPEPRAILAVSSHWEARQPTASLAAVPETIHDFSGFAPALHRMRYPAPGAPWLARRVVGLLAQSGIDATVDPARGLDHGAWVPLAAIFPRAHVPVTQLALIRDGSAARHLMLGRALAPLRDEGVLLLASGAVTHNFAWLDWRTGVNATPVPQAVAFAEWVAGNIADPQALQAYRSAPHGAAAHPSEEHFLPLFVAVGAASGDPPARYRAGWSYGGLAMDAYLWESQAGLPKKQQPRVGAP